MLLYGGRRVRIVPIHFYGQLRDDIAFVAASMVRKHRNFGQPLARSSHNGP